jgi:hypothetical protein
MASLAIVTFNSDSSFVPLTPRPSPTHPRHWMVQTWWHVTFDFDSSFVPLTPRPSPAHPRHWMVQTWRHVTFDSDSSFVPLTPRPSPAHPRHWMVQTWQHWIERSNDQGSVWVYNFKKCDLKIIILKCVIWKVIFKNGVKCLTKL